MANAQTSSIQQQIEASRQALQTQQRELSQARQKSLERPTGELRGIKPRNVRQAPRGGALTQRLKRGAERERFTKGIKQVKGQEIKFEQEVAQKSPEYGKEQFVKQEYEKVKPIYSQKINELKSSIKNYEDKLNAMRSDGIQKGESERIERIEDNLRKLGAKLGVYSSYEKDTVKAIKGIYTGSADAEANFEEDKIQASIDRSQAKQQFKQDFQKQTGVSYKDFTTRYSPGAQVEVLKQAKASELGITREQAEQQLVKEGTLKFEEQPISATEQSPISSPVLSQKVSFADSNLARDIGMVGQSTILGTTKFAQVQKKTPTFNYERVKLPGESYSPELKSFVAPSDKSGQGTAIITSPSLKEIKAIELASERGSYESVLGKPIVQPVWEGSKRFAGKVLTSPTGQAVVDFEIDKGGTREIYEPQFGTVQVDPTTGQRITGYREIEIEPLTVGKIALGTQTALRTTGQKAGELSRKGWEDISGRIGRYESTLEPGYFKNLISGGKDITKFAGAVAQKSSEFLGTSAIYFTPGGLVTGPSVDLLATGQKVKDIDKYIKIEEDKIYKQYEEDYAKAQADLEEGYELEPKLSREEVVKDLGIKEKVRSQFYGEAVIPLAILGGATVGGAIRGGKWAFKDPIIAQREGKLLLTTRAREVLGTKISIPTKSGEGFKWFKPQTGKYFDISFQTLTPQTKAITPFFDVPSKATKTFDIGKLGVSYYDDIFGITRRITPGQKTIVERGAKEFWWDLGRGKSHTRFYSGDPFTKLGKIERANTLKYLDKLGISQDWSKQILRLKRPQIIEEKFRGDLLSLGDGKLNLLRGDITRQYLPETVSGIKARGGAGQVERITSLSTPVKPIPTSSGIAWIPGQAEGRFGFEMGTLQRETVKLTKGSLLRGPKITTETFVSTSTKLGTKELPSISFMGKETSYLKSKDFSLVLKRKTPILQLSPAREISKGDVYYGLSKVDDISEARILMRRGINKVDDVFSIGRDVSSKDLKLVKSQKQITAPFTEVFKKEVTKKTIPKLKVEQVDDLILAPIKTETKSKYWGTGQYERTEGQEILLTAKQLPGIKENVLVGQFQPQVDKTDERLGLGVTQIDLTKEREREVGKVSSIFKDITKPIERQKITPIERVTTKPVQIFKTPQATKLRTPIFPITGSPRPEPRPKPPRPKKTIRPIPPKFDDPLKKRRPKIPTKKKGEEFIAITKRYGKERVIAKGKDLSKIIGIGKSRVKQTLGATLKVKTTKGKQVQLTPTKQFRKSKTDPLAIVQRRETRLGTFGERKEIKQARKLL